MRVRSASIVATGALLIGAVFMSAPAAGAGRLPRMIHHGMATPAHVSPAGVLFNQNDRDDGVSISSQNFGAEFDSYDDQAADDFKVPAGVTWTVKKVTVTGVYYSGEGPADSENVFVYRSEGGLPSTLKSEVDDVVGADSGGSFVIPTGAMRLTGGTAGKVFWLSVQINMEPVNGGQWGWETRKVKNGNPAAWQNPSGGWGGMCRTWTVMRDCFDVGPDLMFALSGTAS